MRLPIWFYRNRKIVTNPRGFELPMAFTTWKSFYRQNPPRINSPTIFPQCFLYFHSNNLPGNWTVHPQFLRLVYLFSFPNLFYRCNCINITQKPLGSINSGVPVDVHIFLKFNQMRMERDEKKRRNRKWSGKRKKLQAFIKTNYLNLLTPFIGDTSPGYQVYLVCPE